MLSMLKSISLSDKYSLFFFTKNQSSYIHLKLGTEIHLCARVPKGLKFSWQKSFNKISFNCTSSIDIAFYNRLLSFLRFEKQIFKVKIFLRGLGYKINLILSKSLIEFKIGYSHLCTIQIPQGIRASLIKNQLLLESGDKEILGNFAHKIYLLRPADVYKSRGFLLKHHPSRSKIVKKK